MAEHVPLGRLLVERGLIAPEQLDQALAEQERSRRSLGVVLVEMGAVREDELVAALAHQVGLDFVDLASTTIAPAAAARVPLELARRHQLIAIGERDGALVVAVADPSNAQAVEQVRATVGVPVVPVVATRTAIEEALDDLARGRLGDRRPVAVAPPAPVPSKPIGALLLAEARQSRASEVHLEAGRSNVRLRYRVDGVLHDIAQLAPDAAAALRASLTELAAGGADVRVVTLATVHGETLVVRLLDRSREPRRLAQLGIDPVVLARLEAALAAGHGAILVTGPGGSGVTSLLHGLLLEVVVPDRHVVAVEDPIERELDGVSQVVVGPDLPVVTTLRRALAASPDVALVGELRDGATAAAALDAALGGRLVLAGLAGRTAASTPARLVAMGLDPVLVAGAVQAVAAVRLLRRLCPSCAQPWVPSDEELDAAGWEDALEPGDAVRRAVGCDTCGGTGYDGVVPVVEVLTMTDDVARLIAGRASASDVAKLAAAQGMVPLRSAALALVRSGATTLHEVARAI